MEIFWGSTKRSDMYQSQLKLRQMFAGVNEIFSSIREPGKSCDGGGLSDLWRAHECQVDPAKCKLCSKSRQSVVSERT